MRRSLVPGLIENLRINLAQRAKGFGAFALGKVFFLGAGGAPEERQHLAALLYGRRERRGLRAEEAAFNFLDAKGLVEGLLERSGGAGRWSWSAEGLPSFLHPGRAAWLAADGMRLGYIGEVHPDIAGELSLPRCLILELDFEIVLQYLSPELKVRFLPRFPSVERGGGFSGRADYRLDQRPRAPSHRRGGGVRSIPRRSRSGRQEESGLYDLVPGGGQDPDGRGGAGSTPGAGGADRRDLRRSTEKLSGDSPDPTQKERSEDDEG